MLEINPQIRPSSPEVFIELNLLQEEYEKGQDDEITAALKGITVTDYSFGFYNEVMYRTHQQPKSFIDMSVALMHLTLS